MKIRIDSGDRGKHTGTASQGLQDWLCEVISRGSGVEVRVEHGLGRRPQGAHTANAPGGACYFDPWGGYGTPWSRTYAYFTPQTAVGTVHRFRLY